VNLIYKFARELLRANRARKHVMGLCRYLNLRDRLNDNSGSPILHVLLVIILFSFLFGFLCGHGLDLCSANFSQERLGCGRS